MKKPLWKKWWSYIQEVHIETVTSDYNEELHVVLNKGRYQLCTPNAIYSYEDKYTNFRDSFAAIKLDEIPIKNVLVLGFGLGSIPFILEKVFHKNYNYTGVEIDDAIIYLAAKYGTPDLTSNIEVIQADAWNYVMQSETSYDMICVDIFEDVLIPNEFLSLEFLEALQEILSKKGVLLFNHMALKPHEINAANQYFKDVFTKVFEDGVALPVKGNIMIISDGRVIRKG